MNKAVRLFLLFAICVFALSAAGLTGAVRAARSDADSGETEEAYVVRSENGSVLLYGSDGTTLLGRLDIRCEELPPEDRALLESGVFLESRERLMSLLEDYT